MSQDADQSVYKKWLSKFNGNLFDRVPFGHLVILPNQLIISVNSKILEWLGVEASVVLNKKRFSDLISMGGKIFYETHHRPLEKIQGYISELNYTLIGKDKQRIPVLINTQQEKNDAGEVLFTQFFIFDISERKEYEKELIAAKKNAESAAEAKDRFISTISHEIRTPLHGIMGTTDLLIKNESANNKEELLKVLQFSTQSLLELINDVLDFTKGEADKVRLHEQPFNLKDTVGNLVHTLKSKAREKGLEIITEIDTAIPDLVIGDAVKLSQVLNNLIGNAIKFTIKGVIKVIVRIERLQEKRVQLYFEVADSGVGIPPEKLEEIFTPFAQLKDELTAKSGGTGLGLTISRRLVKLFGSKLLLKSEVGKGSTFYFSMEIKIASEEEIENLQVLAPDIAKTPLDQLKVLMVEDNATNTYIASLYFKKWKLDFDTAENGKIAIAMLQKKTYDLVLMDLRMPVMDGYETSKAIRNLSDATISKVPIIALTASTFSTIQDRVRKAGISGLMSKPFKPKELYQLLQNYQNDKMSTTPVFQIDYLINYFDKDTTAVLEFIEIILIDFSEIRANIIEAIQSLDLERYKEERHKTITTLKLLKATRLQALLTQGGERLSQESVSNRDRVFQDLVNEFDALLEQLAKVTL